jgi:hypothetical protein
VQEFKKYYDRQLHKKKAKTLALEKAFQALLHPLIEEEKKKAIGVRNARNYNYERMYGKFYIKENSKTSNNFEERLIHDTESDPILKARYDALTYDEKKFIDFINERTAEQFAPNAYLNTEHYEYDDITYTKMGLHNHGKKEGDMFEFKKGFFFKVPVSPNEISEKYGFGRAIRSFFKYNLSYFVEDNYSNELDTQQAIPIKFLGNSVINGSELYSRDLSQAFLTGMDAIANKEAMDSVHAMGSSLTSYFNTGKLADSFQNTSRFLEMKMFREIQGKMKRMKWSRRSVTILCI